MGFGFNLGMIIIILPLTGLLFLIWLITRKKIFRYSLAIIWGGIVGLVIMLLAARPFFEKIKLNKDDYYGEYVIDRSFFPGEQADWQYNHFRFKITEDDSIFFYVTEQDNVLQTYKGVVSTTKPYSSARLIIEMDQPTHHVITSNPTTYRDIWHFNLVFDSPYFDNMFFKKGDWKPISNEEN